MVLKKYYRPISICLVRSVTKLISCRLSYYNEAELSFSNITVLINMDVPKAKTEEEIKGMFGRMKQILKTEFLLKQFTILQKSEEGKSVMQLE